MKSVLVPIVAMFFVGCASYGSDFDITKFSVFKNGVTTKSEMIKLVGSPNSQSNLGNGQTTATWQFVSKAVGSEAKSKIATAVFDSQDRLVRVTTSESKY